MDCSSLNTISLPPSIEEIGNNIFDYCENLKIIYVHKESRLKMEKMLWKYKDKLVDAV